jgi:hypothetical protein
MDKKLIKAKANDVDIEISKYRKYLDSFINDEDREISKEANELRNYVLFAHAEIESLLHTTVYESLIDTPRNLTKIPQLVNVMFKVGPFLEELDFYPLVRAARETGILTSKEENILSGLNAHRRRFAHPNGYREELAKYSDKKEYLKTLQLVSKAIETIVAVINRNRKEKQEKYEKVINNLPLLSNPTTNSK